MAKNKSCDVCLRPMADGDDAQPIIKKAVVSEKAIHLCLSPSRSPGVEDLCNVCMAQAAAAIGIKAD